MPKRTNDFQRLVLAIERTLAGTEAHVEESAMLLDRTTGVEVEVDIVITVKSGPRQLRVGVECRDHTRPQGPSWIRDLRTKREDLGLDRIVAVSKAGLSRTAKIRAEMAGIGTLSLEDAIDTDWCSTFDELTFVSGITQRAKVQRLTAVARRGFHVPQLNAQGNLGNLTVVDRNGEVIGTAIDIATYSVSREQHQEFIDQNCKPGSPLVVKTTVRFKSGERLVDAVGQKVDLLALTFVVAISVEASEVPDEHGDYGTTRVATASFDLGKQRAVLAFVQPRDGDAAVTVVSLPDDVASCNVHCTRSP